MLLNKMHNPKKIEWKDCRQVMSSGNFLDKLKNFNRNDIPKKVVDALEAFKASTPEFALDVVKNQSESALSLAKWAYAIMNYAKVAKDVEPKKKMVDLMDAELKKAQGELNAKTERLREEMKKVEDLEREYTDIKDKKERLENEIESCKLKLVRAEKLVGLLESEHERWKENVELLDTRIQ